MSLVLAGNAANVSSVLSATVTALANNGGGLVRVTTSAAHLFGQGDLVLMNASPAVGLFNINVIDSTHFDLQGSTFSTTGTGTVQDLSLTPQIQVPTDGDTFSLQLSGMLSALQGVLDRTQFLRAWAARREVQTVCSALRFNGLGTGWTVASSGLSLVGPQTTAPQFLPISPDCLHQGATLSSVSVAWNYVATVPTLQPTAQTISVVRYPIAAGATPGFTALSSTDPQSPASVSFVTTEQLLTYTCNQNNVIDKTQYVYGITIEDQSGANAKPASYDGMLLTYSVGPTS